MLPFISVEVENIPWKSRKCLTCDCCDMVRCDIFVQNSLILILANTFRSIIWSGIGYIQRCCMTVSSHFEHFIICKCLFFCIEIKSFLAVKKIWCNNTLNKFLSSALVDIFHSMLVAYAISAETARQVCMGFVWRAICFKIYFIGNLQDVLEKRLNFGILKCSVFGR